MKKSVILAVALLAITGTALAQGPFADMEGHPKSAIVESLAEKGIVEGDNAGNFNPNADVTRGEFVTMMARMMDLEQAPYDGRFQDVTQEAYYAQSVSTLAEKGIVEGSDGMFYPERTITHEEAVKMAVACYEWQFGPMQPGALGTIFNDYFEVSPWARAYLHKGVALQVAKGFEQELSFDPQGNTTRVQAAEMIYRLDHARYVSEKFGGEAQ